MPNRFSLRPLVLLAVTLLTTFSQAAEAPASLVILNGKVLTADAKGTTAGAVAIRGNEIVFVGDTAGARKLVGPATRVIDARGQSVIPGLFETHVHAITVARDQLDVPFQMLSSIAEIGVWVRQKAAKTPADQWIRIPRVDLTRLKEGRFPTRAELDAMLPDRPLVFDWSYAGINQVQVLNSAAIKAAKLTRETADPKDGRIVRDAAGEPTGVLRNGRSVIDAYLPKPAPVSREQLLGQLEAIHRHYNTLGITSVFERRTDLEGWQLYSELKDKSRLHVRTTATIGVGYQGTGQALRQIENLSLKPGQGDDWLRVGPLKIRVDGGLLYGTAFLREPFLQAGSARYYDLPSATNRGELILPRDEITAVIRAAHKAGWQMSCHVAGDAAVDVVLDAVEAADRDKPIATRRFTLIHAYLPNPETAKRAARLGVTIDTQPVMYYKDGDALAHTIGAERATRVYGLREWLDAGVKVSINADHMAGLDPNHSLNPYNPFLALYVAVSRKTESGQVFGPRQKVTRGEALRMMTIDAAWLSFDEQRRGSIEVGKLADVAILSHDYLRCPEEDIRKIQAVATVLDGKVVYERGAAR